MRDGILILCNYIRAWYGKSVGVYYPEFAVSVEPEEYGSAMLPVVCIFAILVSWLLVELVKSGAPYKGKLRLLLSGVITMGAAFMVSWILFGDGVVGHQISEFVRFQQGKETLLPEGDFSELTGKSLPDQTALNIVMSNPQSYYLRGFVGTKYTGSGFVPSSNETNYEYQKLDYMLSGEQFEPFCQLAQVNSLVGGASVENHVKVQTKEASAKYLYLPYELMSDALGQEQVKQAGDVTHISRKVFGARSYGFSAEENLTGDYLSLSKAYEQYLEENEETSYELAESYYNVYVYEQNLSLPEQTRALLQEELGEFTTEGNPHFPYYEAKKKILEYLNQNIEYDTSVGNETADEDFLYGFLRTTKQGYDVQFAAAATLMYRYYGIPARYVEGFLVTQEDAKLAKPYERMEISCKNAHAWVEIYQDGIGWIPIEVTPPYFMVMEQSSDITVAVGASTGESDTDIRFGTVKPEEQDEEHHVKEREYLHLLQAAISAVLVLLLAAGIFCLLMRIKKDRTKKRKLLQSFCLENRSEAVCNLYRVYREAFETLPAIVEQAAFSPHPVSEEEYQSFYQRCQAYAKTAK